MRRLLLVAALFLTACAAAPVPVGASLTPAGATPQTAAGRAVLAEATATAAVAGAAQAQTAAQAEAADLARRQAEQDLAERQQALDTQRQAAANAAARDLADTQAHIIAAEETARVAREQANAAIALAQADAARLENRRLWDWRLAVGTRLAVALLLLALAMWCVGWAGLAFARSFPRYLAALADDRADQARHDAELRRIERLRARVDIDNDLVYTDFGPRRLPGPVTLEPSADAWQKIDNDKAWDLAVCRFLEFGHLAGSFSQDRLEREGIVTRDAWDALTGWLVSVGVLEKSRRGTVWTDKWDIGRWRNRSDGDISLPYPPTPAPEVRTWEASAQRAEPAHSGAQSAHPA